MSRQPRALVFDDDEMFCQAIEKLLTSLGLTVRTSLSSPESWAAIQDFAPDIYLIDLNVGSSNKLNGFDLINELREKLQSKVPIIVISATENPEVISHALEIGANDYILKPLNQSLVAKKIGQYSLTEEIEKQGHLLKFAHCSGLTAQIGAKASVIGIDELGVEFICPHLIPKGASITIDFPEMREIGATQGCQVSVVSTALVVGSENYEIYAEFENPGVEFLRSVRTFIVKSNFA